jgi:hypothetical protein
MVEKYHQIIEWEAKHDKDFQEMEALRPLNPKEKDHPDDFEEFFRIAAKNASFEHHKDLCKAAKNPEIERSDSRENEKFPYHSQ